MKPDRNATDKRARGSPTGETPLQTTKRRLTGSSSRGRACRSMFLPWTDVEECALIEFVLLTRTGERWTTEKSSTYWKSGAEYVCMRSGCQKRSGEDR